MKMKNPIVDDDVDDNDDNVNNTDVNGTDVDDTDVNDTDVAISTMQFPAQFQSMKQDLTDAV